MSLRNDRLAQSEAQTSIFHSRMVGAVGILMLIAFALPMLKLTWNGYSDFDQIYLAGLTWRKGLSPYNGHLLSAFVVPNGPPNTMLQAYYYSPFCGLLAAPLSLMGFPTAVFVWKLLMCGTFLYGCWRFMGHLPILSNPNLRLFLVGMTALSGSMRWCLKQLQPSLLVAGLLILFVCFVVEKNRRAALICGVLIGIKLTYLLPALALLLILRDYRLLRQILGWTLVLNLIALVPTGFTHTLQTYREAVATFEDLGKMTRPDALDFLTPFLTSQPDSPLAPLAPPRPPSSYWAGEQLHYTFLVSGLGVRYPLSRMVGQVLTGLTLVGFFLLWKRTKFTAQRNDPEEILILFAAILAFSLLIVYHQRYDAVALIPGFFVALSLLRQKSFRRLAACVFVMGFVLCYALTGGILDAWHGKIVVPHGWLFLVPICSYMTLISALCLAKIAWQKTQSEKGELTP